MFTHDNGQRPSRHDGARSLPRHDVARRLSSTMATRYAHEQREALANILRPYVIVTLLITANHIGSQEGLLIPKRRMTSP